MPLTLQHLTYTHPNSNTTLTYHQEIPLANQGFTLLTAPSGTGKTTLLHLVAGLLPPTSGEIWGADPKTIALQFQEPRLFPWRTVAQHLTDVAGKQVGPHPFLEAVGLDQVADHYPASLSGGMARRLSLARTLCYGQAMGASLYLLDEPFAGVDAERITQLLPLLQNLEAPVILASHLPQHQDQATQVVALAPQLDGQPDGQTPDQT